MSSYEIEHTHDAMVFRLGRPARWIRGLVGAAALASLVGSVSVVAVGGPTVFASGLSCLFVVIPLVAACLLGASMLEWVVLPRGWLVAGAWTLGFAAAPLLLFGVILPPAVTILALPLGMALAVGAGYLLHLAARAAWPHRVVVATRALVVESGEERAVIPLESVDRVEVHGRELWVVVEDGQDVLAAWMPRGEVGVLRDAIEEARERRRRSMTEARPVPPELGRIVGRVPIAE